MYNVQLPGSKTFDSQILMHYFTQKNDVSMAKKFQKNISMEQRKNGVTDQGNIGNELVKENGQTESIMFRIMLRLHTNM